MMDADTERALGALKQMAEEREAKERSKSGPETRQNALGEARREGQLIRLRPRQTGSLKLEQNLGCELPVCVSNRRDVNKTSIRMITDTGQVWALERGAESKLPAPEHYPYWLWFLDRLQAAAEQGVDTAPKIELNPSELFDLFGSSRGGKSYEHVDDAFKRFGSLLVKEWSAFFDGGREYETSAVLGVLCSYRSWRAKPVKGQEVLDFAKGWVSPGPVLWASVRSGYLKSVPLKPLRGLDYVGQRLFTYLSKHCRIGDEFAIATQKLLPKIPLECAPDQLKHRLAPHHEALVKEGFLADAKIDGRGADKRIIYRRTQRD